MKRILVIILSFFCLTAYSRSQFVVSDTVSDLNHWRYNTAEAERIYYHSWALSVKRDTVLLRLGQTVTIRTDSINLVMRYDSVRGSGNARRTYYTAKFVNRRTSAVEKIRQVRMPYSTADSLTYFWAVWPAFYTWAWSDTTSGALPVLEWRFQLSKDSTFSPNLILVDTLTIAFGYAGTDLENDQIYYGRVKLRDEEGWEDWLYFKPYRTPKVWQKIFEQSDEIIAIESLGITIAINPANRQAVLRVARAQRPRFEHN